MVNVMLSVSRTKQAQLSVMNGTRNDMLTLKTIQNGLSELLQRSSSTNYEQRNMTLKYTLLAKTSATLIRTKSGYLCISEFLWKDW